MAHEMEKSPLLDQPNIHVVEEKSCLQCYIIMCTNCWCVSGTAADSTHCAADGPQDGLLKCGLCYGKRSVQTSHRPSVRLVTYF
jgi:hypothetical protein